MTGLTTSSKEDLTPNFEEHMIVEWSLHGANWHFFMIEGVRSIITYLTFSILFFSQVYKIETCQQTRIFLKGGFGEFNMLLFQ